MQERLAIAARLDPLRPTVFHQPWWLNAATNGNYAEATLMQSGRQVGCFPYVLRAVSGWHRFCGMPCLTPVLGPAIDDGTGAACNRVLRRAQITRELLAQVPSCNGFRHKLHSRTAETLVYQELGYEASVQFTFEVLPAPPETLWRAMGARMRASVLLAQQQHRVRLLDDSTVFASSDLAWARYHAGHGAAIQRLCRAALDRGQGQIFAAETLAGTLAAAIFVVWDKQTAHCVLVARRPGCEDNVIGLLLWQALQDCAARTLIFDCDGIATAANAAFMAGLGGRVRPRYVVSRFSRGHKLAGRLRAPFAKDAAGWL